MDGPSGSKERPWIAEKKCYLCSVSLGYGTFREKKLRCEVCAHAICARCSDPQQSTQDKITVCRKCAGLSPLPLICEDSEIPSMQSVLVDFGGISDVQAALSEDTQLTDEVLAAAKQLLEEAQLHGRANSQQFQDHVLRFSQRLSSLHSEMSLARQQEARIAEELRLREAQVNDLSLHNGELRHINIELTQKIRLMEEKIAAIGRSKATKGLRCCGAPCELM